MGRVSPMVYSGITAGLLSEEAADSPRDWKKLYLEAEEQISMLNAEIRELREAAEPQATQEARSEPRTGESPDPGN